MINWHWDLITPGHLTNHIVVLSKCWKRFLFLCIHERLLFCSSTLMNSKVCLHLQWITAWMLLWSVDPSVWLELVWQRTLHAGICKQKYMQVFESVFFALNPVPVIINTRRSFVTVQQYNKNMSWLLVANVSMCFRYNLITPCLGGYQGAARVSYYHPAVTEIKHQSVQTK